MLGRWVLCRRNVVCVVCVVCVGCWQVTAIKPHSFGLGKSRADIVEKVAAKPANKTVKFDPRVVKVPCCAMLCLPCCAVLCVWC